MSFYQASRALLEAQDFRSPYVFTAEAVERARAERPCWGHVKPVAPKDVVRLWRGQRVTWDIGSGQVFAIPANKIRVLEWNIWYDCHAAAVSEAMRRGQIFAPPAGRLYKVTEEDVAESQAAARSGDLQIKFGRDVPYTSRDVGDVYVQLFDGNHRAVAAILAGETVIPVSPSQSHWKHSTEYAIT